MLRRTPEFDTRESCGDRVTSAAYLDTMTGNIVRYGHRASPECIELPDETQGELHLITPQEPAQIELFCNVDPEIQRYFTRLYLASNAECCG